VAATLLALAGVAGQPAAGAGFGIFEQGTRAMGMAGAFTAQANDPSALFHNPAGIAFQDERDFLVGFTWITSTESDFQGAAPFPGPGVTAEQETLSELPPHFYWIEPLGDRLTFGFGIMTPFGLTTDWKNPNEFAGRFISTMAALRAFDFNPTVGLKLTDRFSVGVGAVLRASDVELVQHVPFPNPFTQTISDVAFAQLESDIDTGFGFNVGLLHRTTNYVSWGLSYRSGIEIDYSGEGVFTQILTGTPIDALVPTQLPLDQDIGIETTIDFPEMASFGIAFHPTETFVIELDANWTGWSSFDVLPIDFAIDSLDTERVQNWEDAYNYRLGVRLGKDGGRQWRFGYVFDETPQPEEAVSPLLPDGDRNGLSVGYGWVGDKYSFDIAVLYLDFDDPERFRSFPGEGDFFGTYQNQALLVGLTLGF
jgi:long-chain fatty acid transport protein